MLGNLSQLDNNTKQDIVNEQGLLSGEVSLLPIQEWFFENSFIVSNHWNQSFLIKVPSLDLSILQISVAKLINYHDSFRLRYKENKDSVKNSTKKDIGTSYIQYYDNNAQLEELKTLDIRNLKTKEGTREFKKELQNILTKWQSNFNLEKGPVYSIGYIYGYKDGSSRIYFALHHLIVDGVSWRILTENLRDIYNQKSLGSKGSSYRQWVNTVKKYANTHETEKDYWLNILSSYDKSKNNQLSRLEHDREICNSANLGLNKEQTKKLLRESNRAYYTQINDILLTALGYTLFEITGSRVNHIVLEGHGRELIDGRIDITRTLGWFTIMYPVILEVGKDLSSSIKNIKETLRKIPNKGIGYGALIGYKSGVESSLQLQQDILPVLCK